MKKGKAINYLVQILLIIGVISVFFYFPGITRAQVGEVDQESALVNPGVQAIAGGDKNVAVGRKVVFDAAQSVVATGDEEVFYKWDFGGGVVKSGVDVIHEYKTPGFYRVSLTVTQGELQDTDEVIVSVYKDLIVLIADSAADQERIQALKRYAIRQGVLLVVVSDFSLETDPIVEAELIELLSDASKDVIQADIIISWTRSENLGLDVITKTLRGVEEIDPAGFVKKGVVVITENSFQTAARFAQPAFEQLGPEYILLTRENAVEAIIDAQNSENVLPEVYASGVDNFQIGIHSSRAVEELGPTNFISYTINYLINQGVLRENILLILLLPVIALVIVVMRQFFGIKALGIYIPTLLTMTFISTGLKYGLFIFIALLLAASVLRLLLKKMNIFYLPRMALVLTLTAFVILTLFVVGALTDRTGIIELSIFPILILVLVIEKFVEVQIEKGLSSAARLTTETVFVSIVSFYITTLEPVKTFILAYPEVILLSLVANVVIGKWAGLRIFEYIRFRNLGSIQEKK